MDWNHTDPSKAGAIDCGAIIHTLESAQAAIDTIAAKTVETDEDTRHNINRECHKLPIEKELTLVQAYIEHVDARASLINNLIQQTCQKAGINTDGRPLFG